MVKYMISGEHEGKRYAQVEIVFGGFNDKKSFSFSSGWLPELVLLFSEGVDGECFRIRGDILQVEDDESWYDNCKISDFKGFIYEDLMRASSEISLLFKNKGRYGYYISTNSGDSVSVPVSSV